MLNLIFKQESMIKELPANTFSKRNVYVQTCELLSATTEIYGSLSFHFHYSCLLWLAFVENIVKENWIWNLVSGPWIRSVFLDVDEQQDLQEREKETQGYVSQGYIFCPLLLCLFIHILSLFPSNVHSSLLYREE